MPCCGGNLVRGVAGLVKAAARADRAPDPVIAARRDVCRSCDRAEKRARKDGSAGLTTFSRCMVCRCFIAPKSTLASERCPEGRWPIAEAAE
jgi:hypothetical protein